MSAATIKTEKEFCMKNRIKLFGLIAFVAVILATVGSCVLPGSVTIKNQIFLSLGISEVYIRPSGSSNWGSDLLVGSIGYGLSRNFTLSGGPGVYDIKVVDPILSDFYKYDVSSGTVVTFTLEDAF
jgi:hypothetical protein